MCIRDSLSVGPIGLRRSETHNVLVNLFKLLRQVLVILQCKSTILRNFSSSSTSSSKAKPRSTKAWGRLVVVVVGA
eukprot:1464718-Amphidinium_carterae.1